MARLPDDVIENIQKRAESIAYGDITIHLVESLAFVDVEYTERVRHGKDTPKPGQVVSRTVRRG